MASLLAKGMRILRGKTSRDKELEGRIWKWMQESCPPENESEIDSHLIIDWDNSESDADDTECSGSEDLSSESACRISVKNKASSIKNKVEARLERSGKPVGVAEEADLSQLQNIDHVTKCCEYESEVVFEPTFFHPDFKEWRNWNTLVSNDDSQMQSSPSLQRNPETSLLLLFSA